MPQRANLKALNINPFVALRFETATPNARVAKALEYFQSLYRVEALAKGDLPEGETRTSYTYRLRQQHSVPLLEAFKGWLDELPCVPI